MSPARASPKDFPNRPKKLNSRAKPKGMAPKNGIQPIKIETIDSVNPAMARG